MATIKSFTDISQSKVLAEILPLESADYCWGIDDETLHYNNSPYPCAWKDYTCKEYYIPCWSLSALLDIMPKDKSIECSISFGYYNGKGEYIEKWLCVFEKEGKTTDDYIIETFDGDSPVDACVEMIEKLHELNLL